MQYFFWQVSTSKAEAHPILGHDAELDVGVRDVDLAVVEPRLPHEGLADVGEGAVAAEDEVGLEGRPVG